jgi:hypothetical protein
MFSMVLRIAGIGFGLYAMLMLATTAGAVSFTAVFQASLDSLRVILDLGFLLVHLDLWFIQPGLESLRGLGLAIPPLKDDWQPLFIVLWLLFASVSRYTVVSLAPLLLLWAFFLALVTSVMATVFDAGTTIVSIGIGAFFALHPMNLMGNRALPAGFTFISWLSDTAMGLLGLFVDNPIYPAVFLAFAFGSLSLGYGLMAPGQGSGAERLSAPATQAGLDILSVLALAFGLGFIFTDPPLF